tara:strand:- start:51614 stop:51955 length:342 start_codon:yes stop_codon:yes gene_type:complete
MAPIQNTPNASLPLDPITGRVAIKDAGTGKVRWLHSVDAREQLERGATLAGDKVAPRTIPGKPLVDWTGVPMEKLREHAQEAGVRFTARTRSQIEQDLTEAGYIPPVGESDDE